MKIKTEYSQEGGEWLAYIGNGTRFRAYGETEEQAIMELRKTKPGDAYKRQIETILLALRQDWTAEYAFHPKRKWRFDYAVPALKLAIEYQGHGSTGKTVHIGGHGSIIGITQDAEKMNEANLLGWHVITLTALHFRESERVKHKLTPPLARIEMAINQRTKQ